MMSKQKDFLGYIYAMASAVINGCMPIMAKYIYADGVSPLSLVFFQTFLALPSLVLLLGFIFLKKKIVIGTLVFKESLKANTLIGSALVI